ncbi:MAG: hypothetical protein Q7V12_03700 [Deltaproteobacteria bacterium]|nr:hypothetical protein [Deltaproteobacteria bacterium]
MNAPAHTERLPSKWNYDTVSLQKGGAAVQSRITYSKAGIGTLAPDGIPLFGLRPIGPLARRAKRG